VSCGLAELVENSVALVHPEIAQIVTRSTDQLSYVQMILRVVDSTGGTIDELAATLVGALEEAITARYGSGYVPEPQESDDVAGLIADYRDLGIAVVTHLLDGGLRRHMVSAFSDYATGVGTRGNWIPTNSEITPALSRGRRRTSGPAIPG
jgi:hypothetical protein